MTIVPKISSPNQLVHVPLLEQRSDDVWVGADTHRQGQSCVYHRTNDLLDSWMLI